MMPLLLELVASLQEKFIPIFKKGKDKMICAVQADFTGLCEVEKVSAASPSDVVR